MKTLILTAAIAASLGAAGAAAALPAGVVGFRAPAAHRVVVQRIRTQPFVSPGLQAGSFRVIRAPVAGGLDPIRFDHDRRFDQRFDRGRGRALGGETSGGGAFPLQSVPATGAAAAAMESDDIDPMAW